MAVLPDVEFAEHLVHLGPGDTLILYTDGVVDATNAEQGAYGTERLVQLALDHHRRTAEELAAHIVSDVARFVGDAPRFDDLTLVIAKRLP
jgi:sigma-B regulation protein RsbU (phosphoserine phosphatase)